MKDFCVFPDNFETKIPFEVSFGKNSTASVSVIKRHDPCRLEVVESVHLVADFEIDYNQRDLLDCQKDKIINQMRDVFKNIRNAVDLEIIKAKLKVRPRKKLKSYGF